MAVTELLLKYNPVSKLKVPIKLGVSALLTMALVLFLLFEVVEQRQHDIDFRHKEMQGTYFIPTLYQIMNATQVTRGLTNSYLNGRSNIESQIQAQRDRAFAAYAELFQLLDQQGDLGELRSGAQAAQKRFEQLNNGAFQGRASEVFAQYSALVDQIRALIVKVGDDSNLTLDPELDTYYMMDYLVFKAHNTIEATGVLRGRGAGIIASGDFDSGKLIPFARVLGEANIAGTLSALDSAINANASLATKIQPVKSAIEKAQNEFGAQVLQIVESRRASVSSAEYFELGTQTIATLLAGVETITPLLREEISARVTSAQRDKQLHLISTIIIILVAFYVLAVTIVSIVVNLNRSRSVLAGVAQGDLSRQLDPVSADEFTELAESMNDTTRSLKQRIEADRKTAQENGRIKQALDNVSTNVMIADADYYIVYINPAMLETLQKAEAEIQKALPKFKADKVVGSNIDIFHKRPEHQRAVLDNLSGSHYTEIKVAGLTFSLNANPIVDEDGQRIGTVQEWCNRTDEVAIEQEVATIIEAATAGNLSKRVSTEDKQGFFAQISQGLNELLSISEDVIGETGKTLEALAHGKLDRRIERDYLGVFEKLKDDANATVDKLVEVLSTINHSAITVASGAEEIAQGNADLSQRTEAQAASLEETAASMDEMTSTVKQSEENAKEAARLADDARTKATQGGAVVERAVSAMSEINQSSKRISDIIGVIDEIAFQTNLLALNAAVEAARAGEQGRGFAVVAGEVRNLAQRSAAAAKEIKDLINDSVGKVQDGTQLVNESGTTLAEIVSAVERVTSMIAEISVAATEQSTGIEQVNKAVSEMDEMTQQNAALVEQASAAGESMSEQAQEMRRQLRFFNLATDAGVTETVKTARTAPKGSSKAQPVKPTLLKADSEEWEEF